MWAKLPKSGKFGKIEKQAMGVFNETIVHLYDLISFISIFIFVRLNCADSAACVQEFLSKVGELSNQLS